MVAPSWPFGDSITLSYTEPLVVKPLAVREINAVNSSSEINPSPFASKEAHSVRNTGTGVDGNPNRDSVTSSSSRLTYETNRACK